MYKLCMIVVTIPASSCPTGHCFSGMRFFKTCIKNSMTDARLSTLAVLYVENKLLKRINIDE